METTRRLRRMVGLLAARLPEVGLGRVADPRGRRGRRWKLPALLTSALVTLLAGARSTADAEQLTAKLSPAMRRRLRIARRVPDTTLRDTLCALDPDEMRRLVHRAIDHADRRKALAPDGLPFGVVAMDGKSVTLPSWNAWPRPSSPATAASACTTTCTRRSAARRSNNSPSTPGAKAASTPAWSWRACAAPA